MNKIIGWFPRYEIMEKGVENFIILWSSCKSAHHFALYIKHEQDTQP